MLWLRRIACRFGDPPPLHLGMMKNRQRPKTRPKTYEFPETIYKADESSQSKKIMV